MSDAFQPARAEARQAPQLAYETFCSFFAPKYWMAESGGRLRIAVENYLNDRAMTVRDVALMRAYLSQWIQSPVWDAMPSHDENSRAALASLRAGVGAIACAADIRAWLHAAMDEGHDPL